MTFTRSGVSPEWDIDRRQNELVGKMLTGTMTDNERREHRTLSVERSALMSRKSRSPKQKGRR